MKASPEYGVMEDLTSLANQLHKIGKKIMLDVVFNHMGISSPLFKQVQDMNNPYHNWSNFDEKYPQGGKLWTDVKVYLKIS
jgi:glycosidase